MKLEKISRFLEWHEPHEVRKKMLENLLGPYLGHNLVFVVVAEVLALVEIRHCSKLQSSAVSKKTNKPNLRKCQKN